ncbi:MAG: AAA family ATPase [Bacteroidetes bacterium]|nr:AAA family ATPase [Bacteroidota bacterium]MBI3482153.1 AAA family ATPase [Bacteroidota bacterium]
MKFFLIGLPGSGKTTLGKQLAEKMKLPFVDLDLEIEKTEGKTIQEIFAEKKENYFREMESKTLKKFCSTKTDFVMATGGGAPCFFNNMEVMNHAGKTIFLDVPASEIALRLQKTNLTERPLFSKLSSEQLKDKIEWLRSQRIHFYRQSNIVILENSLDEILRKIKD